jgi:hypothetical protein
VDFYKAKLKTLLGDAMLAGTRLTPWTKLHLRRTNKTEAGSFVGVNGPYRGDQSTENWQLCVGFFALRLNGS